MARLPQFVEVRENTTANWKKLDDWLDNGEIEYPGYIYSKEEDLWYVILPDKSYIPLKGSDAKQVIRVDALPSIATADEATLYILGNTVYTFNGEAFYPTYQDMLGKIGDIEGNVEEMNKKVETIKQEVFDALELTTI